MNTTPENSLKRRGNQKRTILDYWNSYAVGHDPAQIHRNARSYPVGPMARLWRAMKNTELVIVMTRGLREPRASLIGNLIAFDRYWNLILANTVEYSFNLDNTTLAGHWRVGRSRKRREQRRARLLRELNNKENFPPFNNVEAPIPCPMEVGDILSLDEIPDDALIWGGDDTRHLVWPTTTNSTAPACAHSAPDTVEAIPQRDVKTQANLSLGGISSSRWVPSVAQLLERRFSKCSSSSSHASASGSNSKQVASGDTQHGQLFIRGANIISVSFPTPQDKFLSTTLNAPASYHS
ncbi:unnamed protein product [Dicrocoelium dendriticum]|nr:unnamed protein product [Dicrocoelium dendriticum]